MQNYKSEQWQLDLPDHWQIEQIDDAVSFYDPDSSGTLLVSTIVEEEPISDDYLEEMVAEHLENGADLHEIEFGQFDGVTCCYEADEGYWCEWYLRRGRIMLFITYDCALEDEGKEDDLIDSILETLSVIQRVNFH
jgi:hypothetical protein